MTGTAGTLRLPHGLPDARVREFADLLEDIAGTGLGGERPVLAAALLFSEPAVQAALPMPAPPAGEMLIHEYQGLDLWAALPHDRPLDARAEGQRDGRRVEYRFGLAPADGAEAVELRTGLRLAPVAEVREAKGLRMRADAGASVAGPVAASRDQIARYAAISGDGNPIHLDRGLTDRLGLPAPVVPGLLLLSLIQPVFAASCPGARLTGMKARFVAPVYEDQPIAVQVQHRKPGRARAFLLLPDESAAAMADLEFTAV